METWWLLGWMVFRAGFGVRGEFGTSPEMWQAMCIYPTDNRTGEKYFVWKKNDVEIRYIISTKQTLYKNMITNR